MNSKEIKNIKKPSYAVSLCKGLFAGTTYIFQCKKCGLSVQSDKSSSPNGTCPKGGYHDWVRTQV